MLLILAGVTITTLTGENGLITKASVAAEKDKNRGTKRRNRISINGGTDKSRNRRKFR